MFKSFMLIATGRSIYSTYFLLVLMVVAPAAVFTEYLWLDSLAWLMLIIIGVFVAITGLVTLKDGLQSAQWPRVEARVKNCSLTWRTNRGTKSYAPKIGLKAKSLQALSLILVPATPVKIKRKPCLIPSALSAHW
ncbi:hypothetical protein [Shewanella colwelliana]|uniref:hypothetical protein n=1 Tax=Shewanella colwelliana TaxID=23 RepID=UPI0004B5958A|nr:hypothetical protein [Shewanella colwelliana]